MRLVFGIIDKEKSQIISMRECLVDILDEWNNLSCEHPRHQVIMFHAENEGEEVSCSWSLRLNISRETITALLVELETLTREPLNGVHVRRIF